MKRKNERTGVIMAIQFQCPTCATRYNVGDHLAGKTAKCGKCRNPMLVPSPSSLGSLPVKELTLSAIQEAMRNNVCPNCNAPWERGTVCCSVCNWDPKQIGKTTAHKSPLAASPNSQGSRTNDDNPFAIVDEDPTPASGAERSSNLNLEDLRRRVLLEGVCPICSAQWKSGAKRCSQCNWDLMTGSHVAQVAALPLEPEELAHCPSCGTPWKRHSVKCSTCNWHSIQKRHVRPDSSPTSQKVNAESQSNAESQGAHFVIGLCSLLLAVGCFLPWLQIGALFQNRGIDNPDGAIVLVAALCCGATAFYNIMTKQSNFRWIYIIGALLCSAIGAIDLKEVNSRAQAAAEGLRELSRIFGENSHPDMWQFVGPGLYVIFFFSVVMLIAALSAPPGKFSWKTIPTALAAVYGLLVIWGALSVLYGL